MGWLGACFPMNTDGDHSKAIFDIAKAGVNCFMLQETAQTLKFSGHRLNVIEPLRQFEIGPFSVIPIPIHHQDVRTGERVPGVGFLISDGVEKLLFYIDSFYCKYRFKGLSIIALGVNYSKKTLDPELDSARKKRLYRSHMSLENAIKFFRANDLSKVHSIFILHVSSQNGDKNYFREEIQKVTGKPTFI